MGSSFIYLVEEVRLILKGSRGRFLWRVMERIGRGFGRGKLGGKRILCIYVVGGEGGD